MVSSDVLRSVLTGTQYKQLSTLPLHVQQQVRDKAKRLPKDNVRILVQMLLQKVNGVAPPPVNIEPPAKIEPQPDKGKGKVKEGSSTDFPREPDVKPGSPKRKPQWKSLRAKKVRKPEPLTCLNPGCNWATDHRPRNFDRVVGNKTAKDKLREWMRQRGDLKEYINARRGVRLPKYKSSLAGETTGDKVFDGKPVPTVAMLHGPPGVGKTTLAALFMTMHKLNFEEVNASDINTEDKLVSVLQRTVYAPNTGLILDEFDGIYQGSDKQDRVSKLLACLGGLNVLTGPVVLIVNDVTQSHVKAIRAKATCLDVRLFPVDKKDLYTVLTDMLRRHNQSLPGSVQSRLIADCNGDVRMMLNASQFTLVGQLKSVVVGGNDAESDHMFTATAELLAGKGTLTKSSLFGEPSLLTSLAFHNYLPAWCKGQETTKSLDSLCTQVDALCVLDSRGWRAHSFDIELLDQTFKALPQHNVVNTFRSKVKASEHNVEWPVSCLLRRGTPTSVPTWITNPTLPHDALEGHAWYQIMSAKEDLGDTGNLKDQWVSTLLEQHTDPECYGRVHGSGRLCALKKKR